jgi:hypothetical protein
MQCRARALIGQFGISDSHPSPSCAAARRPSLPPEQTSCELLGGPCARQLRGVAALTASRAVAYERMSAAKTASVPAMEKEFGGIGMMTAGVVALFIFVAAVPVNSIVDRVLMVAMLCGVSVLSPKGAHN